MFRNSDAVHGGFVAIVGSIYERGVEEAVPWLIVMVCVVVVDLFAGVRCAWLTGERKASTNNNANIMIFYDFTEYEREKRNIT